MEAKNHFCVILTQERVTAHWHVGRVEDEGRFVPTGVRTESVPMAHVEDAARSFIRAVQDALRAKGLM